MDTFATGQSPVRSGLRKGFTRLTNPPMMDAVERAATGERRSAKSLITDD